MGGYGWQYGQGAGPGWWVVMVIFMILFWSVVVLGAIYSVRHYRGGHHHHEYGDVSTHGSTNEGAIEILRTRFAKGELDEAEFKSRLALLEEHH